MAVYKHCETGKLCSSYDCREVDYASVREVVNIVQTMAIEGKTVSEIYNALCELESAVLEINEPAPLLD